MPPAPVAPLAPGMVLEGNVVVSSEPGERLEGDRIAYFAGAGQSSTAPAADDAGDQQHIEEDAARAEAAPRKPLSKAEYEEAVRQFRIRRAEFEKQVRAFEERQRAFEREFEAVQRDFRRMLEQQGQGWTGSPEASELAERERVETEMHKTRAQEDARAHAERERVEAEMRGARAAMDGERKALAESEREYAAALAVTQADWERAERYQDLRLDADRERAKREIAEAQKRLESLMGLQGQRSQDAAELQRRIDELKSRLAVYEQARAASQLGSRAAMDREIEALRRAIELQEKNRKDGESEQALREMRERLRELESAREGRIRLE